MAKPDVRVMPLALDDAIHFDGTFESIGSPNRVTIYRAQIAPETKAGPLPLLLELQRDHVIANKLFIVIRGTQDFERKEFNITLKQATNLLMKVQHDFRRFVGELICVRQGQLSLRDLTKSVFAPTSLQGLLLNQNSSFQLIRGSLRRTTVVPDAHGSASVQQESKEELQPPE